MKWWTHGGWMCVGNVMCVLWIMIMITIMIKMQRESFLLFLSLKRWVAHFVQSYLCINCCFRLVWAKYLNAIEWKKNPCELCSLFHIHIYHIIDITISSYGARCVYFMTDKNESVNSKMSRIQLGSLALSKTAKNLNTIYQQRKQEADGIDDAQIRNKKMVFAHCWWIEYLTAMISNITIDDIIIKTTIHDFANSPHTQCLLLLLLLHVRIFYSALLLYAIHK